MAQKAVIYARVSTANNGQDPTLQTRELREYCNRRGWKIVGEFVDVGVSGTKEKRPELETFQALGIHFVSLSESLDTSTPAGKMVFTVLGAVAELERSLIVERVKAGLRNARHKGKRLGRPRRVVDVSRVAALRAQGFGWKRIAADLGVGVGTVIRHAK
jgi:DNA invertase Pin-like site-specific DNA recombinase